MVAIPLNMAAGIYRIPYMHITRFDMEQRQWCPLQFEPWDFTPVLVIPHGLCLSFIHSTNK